jgi:hypothetical protein
MNLHVANLFGSPALCAQMSTGMYANYLHTERTVGTSQRILSEQPEITRDDVCASLQHARVGTPSDA